MSKLENYIKGKFENFEINEDQFPTEELWGAMKNEIASTSRKRVSVRTVIIFLLLLGSFSGYYIFLNNFVINIDPREQFLEDRNNKNLTVNGSAKDTIKSITILENSSKKYLDNDNVPNKNRSNDSDEKELFKEPLIEKMNALSSANRIFFKPSQLDSESLLGNEEDVKLFHSDYIKMMPFKPVEHHSVIQISSLRLKELESEKRVIVLKTSLSYIPQNNERAVTSQMDVVLTGGSNLHQSTFSAMYMDLEDGYNEAFSQSLGWNVGIQLNYRLTPNWFVGTGLEYSKIYSQFDFVDLQEHPKTLQNQLLKVWINPASGEVLKEEYGNLNVIDTTIRTVRKFNAYDRFALPIEIGKTFDAKRFELQMSVGLQLNYTKTRSSNLLDENLHLMDPDGVPDSPIRKFNVAYRVSPIFSYCINDDFAIVINPRITIDAFKSRILNLANVRNTNTSINLGLRYSLK